MVSESKPKYTSASKYSNRLDLRCDASYIGPRDPLPADWDRNLSTDRWAFPPATKEEQATPEVAQWGFADEQWSTPTYYPDRWELAGGDPACWIPRLAPDGRPWEPFPPFFAEGLVCELTEEQLDRARRSRLEYREWMDGPHTAWVEADIKWLDEQKGPRPPEPTPPEGAWWTISDWERRQGYGEAYASFDTPQLVATPEAIITALDIAAAEAEARAKKWTEQLAQRRTDEDWAGKRPHDPDELPDAFRSATVLAQVRDGSVEFRMPKPKLRLSAADLVSDETLLRLQWAFVKRLLGVYRRGGIWVRLIDGEITEFGRDSQTVVAHLISKVFDVVVTNTKGATTQPLPRAPGLLLLCERTHPLLSPRELTAVQSIPILRPDGTIITYPGWDAESGIYLYQTIDLGEIELSADAARESYRLLTSLLDPLNWETTETKAHGLAVFGSHILSVVGRHLIGSVPMHVYKANSRGSGKTKTVELVGAIALGRVPTPSEL